MTNRVSTLYLLSIATTFLLFILYPQGYLSQTCLPISLGGEIGQAKTNVSGSLITSAGIVGLSQIADYNGDLVSWSLFRQAPGYVYSFNVTNTASPELITSSGLALSWENPGDSFLLADTGVIMDDRPNILVVGVDSGAVSFVDISDHTAATFAGGFVGSVNVTILAVAYNNPFVYLCQSDGNIHIYDSTTIITDPTGTNIVNTIASTNCRRGMVTRNNLLYVSTSLGTVDIYDVSNPLIPVQLSSADISAESGGMNIGHIAIHPNADVLYVANIDNSLANVVVLDVTNSSDPIVSATINSGSSAQPLVGSTSFNSNGDVMYITNTDGELQNFCVSGDDALIPQMLTSSPLSTGYGPNMGRSIITEDISTSTSALFAVQFEDPSVGIPTPSLRIRSGGECGNGIIDPGEDCDPLTETIHSLDYFCCDRATCQFKSNGVVCPGVSGNVCTSTLSLCNGSSTACSDPVYEAIGTNCDADGQSCSTDQCESGGVCTVEDSSNCIPPSFNKIPNA